MNNSLLIFGTKNFNNSFEEIKEYLDFTLVFFNKESFSESSIAPIKILLVDSDVCNDKDVINLINNIKNKPLYIYAVNYNILRITSGMAGLLFSG